MPAPIITSVSPRGVPGSTLTINGTDLSGATEATIGLYPCAILTNLGTVITCTVNAAIPPSLYDVTVTTPSGTAELSACFTVLGPGPSMVSFYPASGVTGDEVTVYGENLLSASSVLLGATSCTILTNTAGELTFTVPTIADGSYAISITTPDGTCDSGLVGLYTVGTPGPGAPTITDVVPTSGDVSSSVVVTGTNLDSVSSVTLGINDCTVTAAAGTSITFTVPNIPLGLYPLEITTAGGTVTQTDAFTVNNVTGPSITSLSAATGPPGYQFEINGTGFGDLNTVQLGSYVCNVVSYTSTLILIDIPDPCPAGVYDVTVTTFTSSAMDPASFTVTAPGPAILSLSESSGKVGDVVTVQGTGLTSATLIELSSTPCAIGANTATDVDFTVPQLAVGTYVLTVTTALGSASASFTIVGPTISGVSPSSGVQGSLFVITGTGLSAVPYVTMGGNPCQVVNESSTSLECLVPFGGAGIGGPYSVSVETSGFSVATLAACFTITAPTTPTITSVAPSTGLVGASVVIAGTNLTSATVALVTSALTAACVVTVNTSTSITFTVPSIAVGTYDVQVTTADGMAIDPASFSVIPVGPSISSLSPNSGPVGVLITITGSILSGATVTLGTTACTLITNTATKITFLVPAVALATYDLHITTTGGSLIEYGAFAVTGPPPTIGAVSVYQGVPGKSITITGTGLSGAAVKFDESTFAGVTSSIDTMLAFTVPAITAGIYYPVVATPAGDATFTRAFTALPSAPVVMSSGATIVGGNVVATITGYNFTGATVTVGGVTYSPTSISDTTIVITEPVFTPGGDAVITTSAGSATITKLWGVSAPPLSGAPPLSDISKTVRGLYRVTLDDPLAVYPFQKQPEYTWTDSLADWGWVRTVSALSPVGQGPDQNFEFDTNSECIYPIRVFVPSNNAVGSGYGYDPGYYGTGLPVVTWRILPVINYAPGYGVPGVPSLIYGPGPGGTVVSETFGGDPGGTSIGSGNYQAMVTSVNYGNYGFTEMQANSVPFDEQDPLAAECDVQCQGFIAFAHIHNTENTGDGTTAMVIRWRVGAPSGSYASDVAGNPCSRWYSLRIAPTEHPVLGMANVQPGATWEDISDAFLHPSASGQLAEVKVGGSMQNILLPQADSTPETAYYGLSNPQRIGLEVRLIGGMLTISVDGNDNPICIPEMSELQDGTNAWLIDCVQVVANDFTEAAWSIHPSKWLNGGVSTAPTGSAPLPPAPDLVNYPNSYFGLSPVTLPAGAQPIVLHSAQQNLGFIPEPTSIPWWTIHYAPAFSEQQLCNIDVIDPGSDYVPANGTIPVSLMQRGGAEVPPIPEPLASTIEFPTAQANIINGSVDSVDILTMGSGYSNLLNNAIGYQGLMDATLDSDSDDAAVLNVCMTSKMKILSTDANGNVFVGFTPPGCFVVPSLVYNPAVGAIYAYDAAFYAPCTGTYGGRHYSDFTAAVKAISTNWPGVRSPVNPHNPIYPNVISVDVTQRFDPSSLSVESSASIKVDNFNGNWAAWCKAHGQVAMCVEYGVDSVTGVGGPENMAGGDPRAYVVFSGLGNIKPQETMEPNGQSHILIDGRDRNLQFLGDEWNWPWFDGWNAWACFYYIAQRAGFTVDQMGFACHVPVDDQGRVDRYGNDPWGSDPADTKFLALPPFNPASGTYAADMAAFWAIDKPWNYFMPIGPAGTPLTRWSGATKPWDILRKICAALGMLVMIDRYGYLQILKFDYVYFQSQAPCKAFNNVPAMNGLNDLSEIMQGSFFQSLEDVRSQVTVIGVNVFGASWQPVVAMQRDPHKFDSVVNGQPNPTYMMSNSNLVIMDNLYSSVPFADAAAKRFLKSFGQKLSFVNFRTWLQPVQIVPGPFGEPENGPTPTIFDTITINNPKSGADKLNFFITDTHLHLENGHEPTLDLGGRFLS